jgi:hypothetical protein
MKLTPPLATLAALAALTTAATLAGCAPEAAKATPPAGAAAPAATTTTDSGDVASPAEAAVEPVVPGDTTVDMTKVNAALAPGRGPHDRTSFGAAVRAGARKPWPAGPKANSGALLPGKRIIAYYGNPHSKKMGVLGEYAPDEMLRRLDKEVARWNAADPSTPVLPALHLVATVAQGDPGKDGKWRRREDSAMVEKVYGWAKSRKGVLFVDIQVGQSTVQEELKPLMKFLERPDVHLGLDPEFSMHYEREGLRPGAKIGTMTAADINGAIRTLDQLVRDKKLPPKVLVVHRFTKKMVPNAEEIRPTANVQVVMDMDGWGPPWLKFDSYRDYIVSHPVQYTGFKLFYNNDTKKGDALLTPRELLTLRPRPLYIQFQ